MHQTRRRRVGRTRSNLWRTVAVLPLLLAVRRGRQRADCRFSFESVGRRRDNRVWRCRLADCARGGRVLRRFPLRRRAEPVLLAREPADRAVRQLVPAVCQMRVGHAVYG